MRLPDILWAIPSSSLIAAAGYLVEMHWKAPLDILTSSESLVHMAVFLCLPLARDHTAPMASPLPATSSVWTFPVLSSWCARIILPEMVM